MAKTIEYYRALPYRRRVRMEDIEPRWRKKDNWRVAAAMSRDDIAGTDVGQFLERVVNAAMNRPAADSAPS